MKEISDIIRAYDQALAAGKSAALATVVHVEGSSYRKPGARMLVTDDGMLTGAISGGCLEGDALRKALLVMADGRPRLVTYDTTDEDDMTLGVQLGCNGIIHIMIEPVDPKRPDNPLILLKKLTEQRQVAVLVTIFSLADRLQPQIGTCLLSNAADKLAGEVPDNRLNAHIMADIRQVKQSRQSLVKTYALADTSYTAFIEWHPPVIHLIVAGAGNDAFPLVQVAEMLGWQITVTDGRKTHANASRFPGGCKILVAKPESGLQGLQIDDYTAAVLMSHNYNYDLALLRYLWKTGIGYIGILGPKKKYDRMKEELEAANEPLKPENEKRTFAPVGLDIGAETPEEIALSIMAEIRAVFAGRKGGMLREMDKPIHDRANQQVRQAVIDEYAVVLLAAGDSGRMGKPKQGLLFKGLPLVRVAAMAALGVTENVVVVTGAAREVTVLALQDLPVKLLHNEHWESGMASSIRTGIHHLQLKKNRPKGIIVMVCDQPYVTSSHLQNLLNEANQEGRKIVTSEYAGTWGPPTYFDNSLLEELMQLEGDKGAKPILEKHQHDVYALSFPEGATDVDTRQEYEELIKTANDRRQVQQDT